MLLLYDIGTTGIKTCLIETDEEIKILGSATLGYKLYVDDETGVKGGAEQRMQMNGGTLCAFQTKSAFEKVPYVSKEQIEGGIILFSDAGLVLVDKEGNCVRHPMSYGGGSACKRRTEKGIAHGVRDCRRRGFKASQISLNTQVP